MNSKRERICSVTNRPALFVLGKTSDDALASHCDYLAGLRLLAEEYLEALSS